MQPWPFYFLDTDTLFLGEKNKHNLAVPALVVFTSHSPAAINQCPKLHTQNWEWLPGLVISGSSSLLCMAFLSPKAEVILSQNNSSLYIIHTVAHRKWQSGKSTHLLFPSCTAEHYDEMPWGPVMKTLHKYIQDINTSGAPFTKMD